MRTDERELVGGVIEKRTYDDSGRLVDIRKVQPPGFIGNHNHRIKIAAGSLDWSDRL